MYENKTTYKQTEKLFQIRCNKQGCLQRILLQDKTGSIRVSKKTLKKKLLKFVN